MSDPDLGTRACDSCAKCGGSRHMHYGRDHEFVEAQQDRQDDGLLGWNTVSGARHEVKLRDYIDRLRYDIATEIEARVKAGGEDLYSAACDVVNRPMMKSLIARATRDAAEGAEKEAVARENHWRKLEGRIPAAPPKPTPDAMREAGDAKLLPQRIAALDGLRRLGSLSHKERDALRAAMTALENAGGSAARLTQLQETARQCRQAWLESVYPDGTELWRDPKITGLVEVLDAFIATPVPPDDGTCAQQLRTLLKFVKSQREQFVNPEVCDQICEMIAGLSQSPVVAAESLALAQAAIQRQKDAPPNADALAADLVAAGEIEATVAAEPVRPRRLLDDDQPDGYLESDDDFIANNRDTVIRFLETGGVAPSIRGDREELRQLIVEACDLLAERKQGNPARSAGHNARLALEAALRLLPVQPGAGEREAENEACAKIADLFAAKSHYATEHAMATQIAEHIRSRQAPHSGDGESK